MYFLFNIITILLSILLLSSCGRKQRSLFVFPEKEQVTFNKLEFPAVHNVQAIKKNSYIKLTWDQIENYAIQSHAITLAGYHVYRLVQGGCIPYQPITPHPITTTNYTDNNISHTKKNYCYVIRAVFLVNDQIIQGPASQIVIAKR